MIKLPAHGNLGNCIHVFDLFEDHSLGEVQVDFQNMQFYDMAVLVGLAAKFSSLSNQNKRVRIVNFEQAVPFKYMQRMGFFELGGINIEESFQRHSANNRFVEMKRIGQNCEIDTAKISTEIADCIAPDQKNEYDPKKTGYYDCIEYSVSELMNNVIQHSRRDGYIGAQYYENTDKTQIVIADMGIGIKQSFIETDSPYSDKVPTDKAAIKLALEPKVSSRTHGIYTLGGPENAGVGLPLLKEVALNSGGEFVIISGNSCFKNNNWFFLKNGFNGTFVSCSFIRSKMNNFDDLLEDAKIKSGLHKKAQTDFSKMFE